MPKRFRYVLITSSIQMKYLRSLLAAMVLPAALAGSCLYYLIATIMAKELIFPEAIDLVLKPALGSINLTLLIALPAVFVVLFAWGVKLSHRFAGPIERVERELDEIKKGELSRRIQLRQDDDLKPMAERLNKILDAAQGKR